MATNDEAATSRSIDRRDLLAKGGVAAAAAVAGATVLGSAAPAGAAPLVPILIPYPPSRLYDSREPGHSGAIANGQQRGLGGDPVEEYAYLLNVTVVNTTGFGWLSIYSADQPSTDASTINWYGPAQTMVNTAYTWIRQSDAGIVVSCGGGGSCQFVLDLTGVLYEYDAGASPAALQAVGASGGGSRALRER